MRILWLNHRDPLHPRAGGAERTILEVGSRLVKRGHSVRLVSAGWAGSPAHARIGGVLVDRYPSFLGPHVALPWILRSRARPEVIVDDLAHVVPWGSEKIARLPGVAFFRHRHARTLPGQVPPVAARLLAGLESLYPTLYPRWPFLVESNGSAHDLAELGISTERCRVIRPGVDLERLRPGSRSASPRLLFFAGMRRYKRPDHALLAFARLLQDEPRAQLLMVGSGPERAHLGALAAELRLGRQVVFTGRLTNEELSRILPTAWVHLCPSIAEGFGYAALEAAACGVPTVAYRVPGLIESVGEGASGRLIEGDDPRLLADAVRQLLLETASWTARCRSFAERFSWETCTDEWERVLRATADTPATAPTR